MKKSNQKIMVEVGAEVEVNSKMVMKMNQNLNLKRKGVDKLKNEI